MTIKKKGGYSGSKPASSMTPPARTSRPMVLKNDDYYKVGNSQFVTVTIRIQLDENCSDEIILRNAADALKFYADNKTHKTWTDKIALDKK
jgi:hypothetical protein